jgi:poly(3-hydroxybutyrate) depolymerase
MVFYWRTINSSAGEFASMAAAIRDGVVQEGGVFVAFQSSTGADALSGGNPWGAGDFNVTDQLFACAVRDHNVDPHRVFTTGCQFGGFFAGSMGVWRSSYVAAVATNSGGLLSPSPSWETGYTPALMAVHGTSDAFGFAPSTRAVSEYKLHGGFAIECNTGGTTCGGSVLAPDIWKFFKAHPFGVSPEPWAGGLPAGFPSICSIP